MDNRKDIYARVTDRIVADLEAGVRPWLKPWNAEHAAGRITRPLRWNGTPYSGINVVMLWSEAVTRGFAAPIWMTYRQAKELKGFVRKGETGSMVVFASTFRKEEQDEKTGETVEQDIPFLKPYTVFNVEQIDGLPDHYYAPAAPVLDSLARIDAAEAFVAETRADIRPGGDMACYSIMIDQIRMPPFETFRDPHSYYSTLLHELTHWTRHPSRLDRDFGRKRFGDEGYAREELVAELGAAFLCADLDIAAEPRADHAAYIGSWLEVLKGDKRAIFTAAAHAQRAADFLHGLQEAKRRAA